MSERDMSDGATREAGLAGPRTADCCAAWRDATVETPEVGRPVLLFSREWMDADFNPEGIIEGFATDDGAGWCGAIWNGCQDVWETDYSVQPTHWAPRPQPPLP